MGAKKRTPVPKKLARETSETRAAKQRPTAGESPKKKVVEPELPPPKRMPKKKTTVVEEVLDVQSAATPSVSEKQPRRRADDAASTVDDATTVAKKRKAPSERESRLAKKLFGGRMSDESSDEEEADDGATVTLLSVTAGGERAALWEDEDDNEGEVAVTSAKLRKTTDATDGVVTAKEYNARLREAFVRTKSAGKAPTWVQKTREESDSDDDGTVEAMTRTAMQYVEKDTRLCKGSSKARLLKDITMGHSDKKPLNFVRFHRGRPLLITGGQSGTMRIFEVDSDAKREHFLRAVSFDAFPMHSFEFVTGGQEALLASKMQEFALRVDLETSQFSQLRLPRSIPRQNMGVCAVSRDSQLVAVAGRAGAVYVLALATMEHITTFSSPTAVVSLQFAPLCHDELWAITEAGAIFVWRVAAASRSDAHSFMDDGVVRSTRLALSRDGAYVATGSNTGIVNLYTAPSVRASSTPRPLFVLDNLLTSTSALAFNHDAQILAAGSEVVKNALKAMHVQTGTVFADLPARYENVPGVLSIDFSPHSAYMAVGCRNGNTRLYEMQHFSEY